jgi:rhodanese-related sulfurtransferase
MSESWNHNAFILLNIYFLQAANIHLLDDMDRISACTYQRVRNEPHILIDVRSPLEFDICHIPESLNLPLKDLASGEVLQQLKAAITEKCSSGSDFPGKVQLFH